MNESCGGMPVKRRTRIKPVCYNCHKLLTVKTAHKRRIVYSLPDKATGAYFCERCYAGLIRMEEEESYDPEKDTFDPAKDSIDDNA
jgi:hypothetical protein